VLGSIFLRSWFTNNLRRPRPLATTRGGSEPYCGVSRKRASGGEGGNYVVPDTRCAANLPLKYSGLEAHSHKVSGTPKGHPSVVAAKPANGIGPRHRLL
jgi:hypothetical protein